MTPPFKVVYNWRDFQNYNKLSSYQKLQVKKWFSEKDFPVIRDAIQKQINSAIKDSGNRREELNAHNDPSNPFRLDIGGEG